VAVSEAFDWRTASGQLKDMSARLLLAKLAELGLIKLPPRQRRGGGRRLRALSEPELFWAAGGGQQLIEGPLEDLRSLELILVEPRTREANDFACYLERDHYLGFGGAFGQNLRYLVRTTMAATWPVCSLVARPGRSKLAMGSSAGVPSSASSGSL
jgi:hypothetical protein